MRRPVLLSLGFLAAAALLLGSATLALLRYPDAFFPYGIQRGRLSLHSDRPFDVSRAQHLLAAIDERLAHSPLDEAAVTHAIFVTNDDWRQRLFFNFDYGAGGVNFYPLTRNVFLRNSDIDRDRLYGPSGKPAEPPRTFTYFATHEIAHTLTARFLGPGRLWNFRLSPWIREGTADFIGMGGRVDVDALYARYRAHEPAFDPRSGRYDRYLMLVSYLIERQRWTMMRLLRSDLSMNDAQAMMAADFGRTH